MSAIVKSKPIKCAYDLDGVVVDFNTGFVNLARQMFGIDCPSPSKSWPTKWDYLDDFLTKSQTRELWRRIVRGDDFWRNLPAYEWSDHLLGVAEKIAHEDGTDLYFVTSRQGDNCQLQCSYWLEELNVLRPAVIVVPNPEAKLPILKALNITHFIDDKRETVNGVKNDSTINVAVWDQPWNQGGVDPRIPRLSSVEELEGWLHG